LIFMKVTSINLSRFLFDPLINRIFLCKFVVHLIKHEKIYILLFSVIVLCGCKQAVKTQESAEVLNNSFF